MPEMRPRPKDGRIERPHELRRARLVCRRTEAPDLERDDFSSNRHPALSFLFEHDLRANASRLSRGKTGTHFSGSCARSGRGTVVSISGRVPLVTHEQLSGHPARIYVVYRT